ncbi:PAS domain S-box protein [Ramlibacter sp. AN1133]|uniref:PAS domain S-box protein n=1 Tax=Ramlibacter sp. AN1133 TaxID=3133429 RepID=UPI0030C028A6
MSSFLYRMIPGAPDEAAGAILNSAVRMTGLGCWTCDVATGKGTLSPEAARIFGFEGQASLVAFATWLRHVHPDDRIMLPNIEQQVRAGQRTFSFEYRFTTPEGVEKRLKSDGEVIVNDRGELLALAGTVLDLTEHATRREVPLAVSGLVRTPSQLETAHEWFWEQDRDFRFTGWSGSAHLGAPPARLIGFRRWELPYAVPLRSTWQEHVEALQRHQPFREFEYRLGLGPRAFYVSTSGVPVFDSEGQFLGYRGTALDITRRIRAEEQARQRKLLLEHASRLGHLGAWSLRLPDMEATWSDESRSILGCGSDDTLSWFDVLRLLEGPAQVELRGAVLDCIARGTRFSIETRAQTLRGKQVWLRIMGEPEPALMGPVRRLLGAIQDISDRKEDEERLSEARERLTATLESITEGFFTVDRQWRYTYANREAERMTHRTREELLGRLLWEIVPSFAGTRFQHEYERALRECRSVHFEELLPDTGTWMEIHAYPFSQGLAVYFQDITERKKAREALQAGEERYRMLFETSMDAILQADASGRVSAANAAACAIFSLSHEQLCSRGRQGLVAADDPRLDSLLQELEANGRAVTQLTMVRGDGSRFEAEVSAAQYRASDGRSYTSMVLRDISERLRQQAEIVLLNKSLSARVKLRTAELESANAELKSFAHSLAHDVRAPLAVIEGFGSRLQACLPDQDSRARHYLARMREAAHRLQTYVEALLSQARISQAELQPSLVDLSALAEAILAELREREPHRQVRTFVEPGLIARGDATLLRIALENLLGNSWKYTGRRPHAEICFSAERQPDGSCAYCVSDNGAGFSMACAHKLFGTFQRLHTHSEFPGTGIGLANVRRIVARHRGRIWAEAAEDRGARFCFTLELGTAPLAASSTRTPKSD